MNRQLVSILSCVRGLYSCQETIGKFIKFDWLCSIWQHLVTLTQTEKITVIITTHYIEEARQANFVGLMRHGRLLAESSPEDLLVEHQKETLEEVFLMLCMSDSSLRAAALAGGNTLQTLAVDTHLGLKKPTNGDVVKSTNGGSKVSMNISLLSTGCNLTWKLRWWSERLSSWWVQLIWCENLFSLLSPSSSSTFKSSPLMIILLISSCSPKVPLIIFRIFCVGILLFSITDDSLNSKSGRFKARCYQQSV